MEWYPSRYLSKTLQPVPPSDKSPESSADSKPTYPDQTFREQDVWTRSCNSLLSLATHVTFLGVLGRFDLAAFCSCHTLNVCYVMSLPTRHHTITNILYILVQLTLGEIEHKCDCRYDPTAP